MRRGSGVSRDNPRCIVRLALRLMMVASLAMLTGCASWFGGSSWFSTKKSSFVASDSTASTDSATTTSIFAKKKKPSPDLCVATARLCESRGDFPGAATQYEIALKDSPDYVPALLSYAHLQDHQNKLAEATTLYQRAVKASPKEASAYNDMGLCYARRGMATEALSAMGKATQLQPDKALYRNNLACVLVDQHRVDDALAQLRAVDNESVANYNLGILLEQRKQDTLAQTHFQRAIELNPQFAEARAWSEHLAKREAALAAAQPGQPQQGPNSDIKIANVPSYMQRPAMSAGAPSGAMGGQPTAQAGIPPMPDTAPRVASIPPSMQRPPMYVATMPQNGTAIAPTPESLGIHALPPVQ
jgi:Flp pilus assembly protein TadD